MELGISIAWDAGFAAVSCFLFPPSIAANASFGAVAVELAPGVLRAATASLGFAVTKEVAILALQNVYAIARNAVAHDANIQPNKHARKGKPLSFDDAVEEVRNGGDVFADSKDTARKIAKAAGDGPPVHEVSHGPGQKNHFHPVRSGQRASGHVLYD